MGKKRTRYTKKQKEGVIRYYRLCRTTADREELAEKLGIGSLSRLYNLASRLGVAGSRDDEPDPNLQATERIIQDPAETSFSKKCDSYLRREFGRTPIEDIAMYLHYSETAILYRARKIKLRKPVKYWKLEKIIDWMGMTEEELGELQSEGIEIFPLTAPDGEVEMTLVSASSLARWLDLKKNVARARKHGADEFFLLEMAETVADLKKGDKWEKCNYLSHGHVCQNPRSKSSFGYYCTNNENYEAGADPLCQVKGLQLDDLRPEF